MPSSDRFDWHGRRHGRRLRSHRQRLVDEMLPRLRVSLPPAGTKLDPFAVFAVRPSAVWLEVGFGSGEHLAEQAKMHPDIGFIGCEMFVNGVAALLSEVERLGLHNLRIVDDDARRLLAALPDSSVGRFFLLFPDPWAKKRHAKRRFIGPANLALLARLLEDGAEFRMATDDLGYVRWTLQHLAFHPDFHWLATSPRDWRQPPQDWAETRYQRKALAARRQVVFLRFQRRHRNQS